MPAVSDAVAHTETVALVPAFPASTSNSTATSELVGAIIFTPIRTTESVAVALSSPVSRSDTISSAETYSVVLATTPFLAVAVTDVITTGPDTAQLTNPFDPIDAIETVNVQIVAPPQFSPQITEPVSTADTPTVQAVGYAPQASDTVTSSEWIVLAYDPVITWMFEVAATEAVAHSEAILVSIAVPGTFATLDAAHTAESTAVQIFGALAASVTDRLTVLDRPSFGGLTIPDTHPPLGGIINEGLSGGIVNEQTSGGIVRTPNRGGNVLEQDLAGNVR